MTDRSPTLDIEAAARILRAYANDIIDEYHNGGTVYEVDYIAQLNKVIVS